MGHGALSVCAVARTEGVCVPANGPETGLSLRFDRVNGCRYGLFDAFQDGDQVLALFPGDDGRTPEREFEVTQFADGTETIELITSGVPACEVGDMIQLSD